MENYELLAMRLSEENFINAVIEWQKIDLLREFELEIKDEVK